MLRTETHYPSYRSIGPLPKQADASNHKLGRKSSSRRPDTIMIERGKLQIYIPVQNILFVKSEHVYCRIFSIDSQQILQRISLEKLQEQLPTSQFLRVHRSYIVNVEHIEKFTSTKILIADMVIPIGRTRRDEVVSYLREIRQ